MQHKFDRHGIDAVRRFPAFDGNILDIPAGWSYTPGAYGCLLSHLQVVCDARQGGLPEVLIFEDDVVFDPHLQEKFSACFQQVPRDWHMLYFGALHKDEPIKVVDNVARLTMANSTYAYALRNTIFDDFIDLNRKAETVLDDALFVLQQQLNCYCFMPHLAWVETDYSDAQNRLEHHWYLKESLVLFGSQADRILSDTTIVIAHRDNLPAGSATENLMYLARYYNEFFSACLDIVIVEQGAQPAINPATLPANCQYVFLRDEGPFNRERCFNTGISKANPGRKLLVLSDSDIHLEAVDLRANLRMCERYDCATGFNEIIDLTDEESLRLRRTKTTRGIDLTNSALRTNNASRGCCCIVSREVIRLLGGLNETRSEKTDSFMSLEWMRQFRVFQSPNHALRLAKVTRA